jgi:hypothetical protein
VIQFAYPWSLLALLALPLIIILYSPRPKRRTLLLSTTLLWREALRERQRGLGLQKLLRDLSLILLLLFVLVLALGLAGPQWLTRARESRDTVLILDTSASMQATDVTGADNRFAVARHEAGQLIADLAGDARMAIMSSGRTPVLRSAFERDKETLQSVLARLQPGDEAGRPREALALALSLLRNRNQGRIYFLSDGAFDAGADVATPLLEYHVISGGRRSRNVAITRFDFRPEIASADRFQVLLTVHNYTGAALEVPATVTLNRNRLFAQNLQLPAHAEKTIVLPLRGRTQGRALAEIEFDDDLAADNRAYAVMGVDEGLRILLIGPGNFYLESVLQALPNSSISKLTEVPAAGELALQGRRYDVVIFDRTPAAALPAGNYLLIDSMAPGLPFTADGFVERPPIAGKGDSALLQQLDLSGVRIDRARRVTLADEPAGLQRLFWSRDSDLALALLQDDIRLVYLGFDLAQSNFPLQAAFPLFISQSLDWLSARAGGSDSGSTQLAAGEVFPIEVPLTPASVIVGTPSGAGLIYRLEKDSPPTLLFDATATAGIYSYQIEGIERYFAVNLTDEYESNISQRAIFSPQTTATADTASAASAQVTIALWPYLSGLALLLLTLEWGLWCARRGSA